MSRPTGRLRIWSFGYAMCTRRVNRLRVSYGVLNLTHRESHEQPALLATGERYRVRIQLNDAGSVFPAGHKVRLAISTAYWPMIWPSPETATVQIFAGTLDLPQRPPSAADAKLSPFPEPETASPEKPTIFHRDGVRIERIDRIGLELGTQYKTEYHVEENDPLSAVAELQPYPELCRETNGISGSRRSCGCHPRAMPSC